MFFYTSRTPLFYWYGGNILILGRNGIENVTGGRSFFKQRFNQLFRQDYGEQKTTYADVLGKSVYFHHFPYRTFDFPCRDEL